MLPSSIDMDITMDEASLKKFEEAVHELFQPINIKDALAELKKTDNIQDRSAQLKAVKRKISIKLLSNEYTPQRIVEQYLKSKEPQPIKEEPKFPKNAKLIKLLDGTIIQKKKGPMPKGAVLVENEQERN